MSNVFDPIRLRALPVLIADTPDAPFFKSFWWGGKTL